MEKVESHLNKSNTLGNFGKEILADGDVYRFLAPKQTLIDLVAKIARGLGQPEHEIKVITEEIEKGKDWRIDGVYNLKMTGGTLVFDNRNGRGVEEYKETMKRVVDSL